MRRFLLMRGLQSLVVIAIMSFVIYALIGLMPGDPIDLMISANPNMTAADAAMLRELYGLDLPIYERYWNWLTAALQAASRPRSTVDYGINLFAFAGISIPSFWLALMLIIIFSVFLGWLPAGGIASAGAGFLEFVSYMVLPVLTIATLSIGSYTRYTRSSMLETLRQDYIRTARAKGASKPRVVWKHALRNALIPVVTILALDFGYLFSGALVTETIFSWPGMGKLIFDSVMGNDFNLALVALLFATTLVLTANLLADICYALLDPRIVIGGGKV